MPSLTFLGAIDTVTGSQYLLQSPRTSVLVDCGLFQGPKKLRERNWSDLPFLDPRAHRSLGLPTYCMRGTRDLLQLLLPDAAHLQKKRLTTRTSGVMRNTRRGP